jgi:hypothetical protein
MNSLEHTFANPATQETAALETEAEPLLEADAPIRAPLADFVNLNLKGLTDGTLPGDTSTLVANRATTAGSDGS